MFLKIFLAAITVCSLLGCLGANRRDNKRIAAVVAIVALILFTVAGSDDYREGRRMGNDYH